MFDDFKQNISHFHHSKFCKAVKLNGNNKWCMVDFTSCQPCQVAIKCETENCDFQELFCIVRICSGNHLSFSPLLFFDTSGLLCSDSSAPFLSHQISVKSDIEDVLKS